VKLSATVKEAVADAEVEIPQEQGAEGGDIDRLWPAPG
jgi:hypothetical protein